jgi:NSS family neurotransmitter:Na+ symporter
MKQENFGSRLGFLLVSAGCAIGIGNVWRFPFITGQNGGAVFVLFYLFFLLIMGIPVLTMELAIGRRTRKSLVQAYTSLEKPGQKWHWHGKLALAGNVLLMMYYTTVCGWMADYFIKFITGSFTAGMTNDAVMRVYEGMLGSPLEMLFWTGLSIVLGFLICARGLQNGLEKVSKYMMSALLVLIVVLAVHSCIMKGAGAGLEFYLAPSLERASEVGWFNVISAAMCQAFFTLSIGQGSMEIFGAYMKDGNSLLKEATTITALDTFVAVMSGLIIFPACFSFGIQPDAGPSLIFITLPNVFTNMAGGEIWGALFFLFMTFASFTTVIAVFENINAMCREQFGWDRKKASLINCILIFVLSIPCVLGFNVWKDLALIHGGNVLDTEDFIVSNLLLPLGSLIIVFFCSWKFGWGFDGYREEANRGRGLHVAKWLKPYFQFVLPALVIVILLVSVL